MINYWLDQDKIAYTIYNEKKYGNYKDCFKAMDNLYHMIKNYIRRNNYHCVSFIIGISNTDSKTAKLNYVRTGKKGRPKREISGKKINWHIHLYVVCEEISVSVFSNKLRLYLQNKKKETFMQNKSSLSVAIPYVKKQCINIRKYGDLFKEEK